MSDEATARLALPLLQIGQAQKEMSHNEALALLDLAVQAAVAAVGLDTPPASPIAGTCWVVGTTPTAAWTGQANALAGWTSDGWRFVATRPGMTVWSIADGAFARFDGTVWGVGTIAGDRLVLAGTQVVAAQQPAIVAPVGGATVDAEARAALGAILAALRTHGLIAT